MTTELPTLANLKEVVRKAGWKPSEASWEDERHIYAFSSEVMPEHWGHPQFAASYHKETGWLSVDGLPPRKLIP